IFFLARAPWARILGLLYPTATLVVIVATANHFWLDAVGGIVCLGFGFVVALLWYGAWPHRLPKLVGPVEPAAVPGSGDGTPRDAGDRDARDRDAVEAHEERVGSGT
ncbi:phosphatase PAP2 family protein, partial [Streptomyces sp.]|uniref:phosphatase PAP2 family protein n=1 Tax=Streptomyces sp. TaxID=1931 RepID=UPI00281233CF